MAGFLLSAALPSDICGDVNTYFLLWVLTESVQHFLFGLARHCAAAQNS